MRFRYTGHQLLAPLNLYYYKARIYSPTLGRFLQTDPIGQKDDMNLYAYVGSNAINSIDPTGMFEAKLLMRGNRDVLSFNDLSNIDGQGKFSGGGAGGSWDEKRPNESILKSDQSSNSTLNTPDKWSRAPRSIQDQMTLDAAKLGYGNVIIQELDDPNYKGMQKVEFKIKSGSGKDSVVHYVKDPKTGNMMDFKFKKHSTD